MHPLSQYLINRSPQGLRTPVALIVGTVDGALSRRLPGLAAEIAFWSLLSLPALVLTLAAGLSVVVGAEGGWQEELTARVVEVSSVALTDRTIDILVRPAMNQLLENGRVGILSFAFLGTLWVASRAVRVVLVGITLAYDLPDERPAWLQRLLGFGLTIGAMVLAVVLGPLLVAGPDFGETLAEWVGPDLGVVAPTWRVVYWPATILVATFAVAALYHVGSPCDSPWRRDLPGAMLATGVWLLGSAGLRMYGAFAAEHGSVYGPLAGPIVALLWIWVTGFAVLLGAQLNAQIERQWPSPQRVQPEGD